MRDVSRNNLSELVSAAKSMLIPLMDDALRGGTERLEAQKVSLVECSQHKLRNSHDVTFTKRSEPSLLANVSAGV